MKIIQVLLLIFISITTQAQDHLVYKYKNSECSANEEVHILSFNNGITHYQSLAKLKEKIYIDSMENLKQPINGKLLDLGNLKSIVKRQNNKLYRYEKLLMTKPVIELEVSKLDWKLKTETKNKNGSTLNKATLNYGGRDWVAWYNPQVAIQEGPYIFVGLPGLIEEVCDSEGKISFLLEGYHCTDYNEDFFQVPYENTYSSMSAIEWQKFVAVGKNNVIDILSMSGMVPANVSEEEKIHANNHFKPTFDCIIER